MSATVQANYYGGPSEGAGTDATVGIRFNREDTQMGFGIAIPIPTLPTVTFFSFFKNIALAVTIPDAAGAISNRSVKLGTNVTLPTGAFIYFLSTPTYRQATFASRPADAPSNGAVPVDPNGDGAYYVLTNVAAIYDTTPIGAGAVGRNGNFCRLVFGVDGRYTGGPGALTLPNIIVGYDES